MPSTGTPSPKTREFATGASLSYTDDGPPERMIPAGEYLRISSILALQGRTTEKTFCSRTRRAISCEYCAPKSRTTIDWASTDEFLRSPVQCKDQVAESGTSLKINSPGSTAADWFGSAPAGRTAGSREAVPSFPRTAATYAASLPICKKSANAQ